MPCKQIFVIERFPACKTDKLFYVTVGTQSPGSKPFAAVIKEYLEDEASWLGRIKVRYVGTVCFLLASYCTQ